MNESNQVTASLDCAPDFTALIASLRAVSADQFDATQLHYLEVLARRAMTYQGGVKHLLDAKLAQALAAFKERFEQALGEAREAAVHTTLQYPHAQNDLQRLVLAADFKGLRRYIASLKSSGPDTTLATLVHRLEQHSLDNTEVRSVQHAGSRTELKTLRQFRNTWSKLSTDKQVAQAIAQAPLNAGPINSHMLVLQSLALMREISPDYLNRFMSYADTLLCLDQCEKKKPGIPKKPAVARVAKK